MQEIIITKHKKEFIKDIFHPVICNLLLLKSKVKIKDSKDSCTFVIEAENKALIEKTKKTITRYLKILEKVKDMKNDKREQQQVKRTISC